MNLVISLLAFLVVFGILVLAHELGHFLAARLMGVKVEEFAFGFPPRIWAKKKGETVYSLNAVPIGGFVRLLGEDWKKSKNPKNLLNKKAWQKVAILAAGVFFNFILAWLFLSVFYLFGGQPLVPDMWNYPGVQNNLKVKVSEVVSGKPAELAGIAVGDYVTKVNGENVYLASDMVTKVDKVATADPGKQVTLTVEHNGVATEKKLATYAESISFAGNTVSEQKTGFVPENTGSIRATWYLAPVVAARETAHITALTVQGFVDFFKTLFTSFHVSESVGGPVVIFELSGAAARLGFSIFLQFIVVLSISLAILNILPFPALDGGHIAFVVIEKIRGKDISIKTKDTVNRIGFGILLLLVAVVTANDIVRSGLFDFLKGIFK